VGLPAYDDAFFINYPSDDEYRPIFQVIIFAIFDCGYTARSALEFIDTGEVRIDKIIRVIGQCRYGIHDISRTELDAASGPPRFNMPQELGFFLGQRGSETSCSEPRFVSFLTESAFAISASSPISPARMWSPTTTTRRTPCASSVTGCGLLPAGAISRVVPKSSGGMERFEKTSRS
jgi:hypothetical protein